VVAAKSGVHRHAIMLEKIAAGIARCTKERCSFSLKMIS